MDAKRWWPPLGLLSLAGIALLAGGSFPYRFLYLFSAATVLPALLLYFRLLRLRGEVQVSSRVVEAGESFGVSFRVTNPGRSGFPYLEIRSSNPLLGGINQYFDLPAAATRTLSLELVCRRRGIYDLGDIELATGDPFGMLQLRRALPAAGQVRVYPRLRMAAATSLPEHPRPGERRAPGSFHEDPADLLQIRQWQAGDSLRRIHWLQTSRQGRLMVRQHSPGADADLAIFVDTAVQSYGNDVGHRLEDLAVELAASVVYERLKASRAVSLYVDPALNTVRRGRRIRDLPALMDTLIVMTPTAARSVYDAVHLQSFSLPSASAVLIISPSLSIADADLLLSLQRRGLAVHLYLLAEGQPAAAEVKISQRLRENGVRVDLFLTGGELIPNEVTPA